jgi:hypothetical protein
MFLPIRYADTTSFTPLKSPYHPHCTSGSSPTIKSGLTDSVADELCSSTTDTLAPSTSPSLGPFRPTILSSDHRNSKLSPSSAATALSSVTSRKSRNYTSSHRQHANPRDGSQTLNESSPSSSTLNGFPTTSSHPVNVNDLAAHHGIPTFLPPRQISVLRYPTSHPQISTTCARFLPLPLFSMP